MTVGGERLKIKLPEDTLNGGRGESRRLHGFGFYAAHIKVPNVSSSITGFFLYRPGPGEQD